MSGKQMVAHLETDGFLLDSIKGSHHKMKNKDGRTTIVPVHGKKELGKRLEHLILKQAGLK